MNPGNKPGVELGGKRVLVVGLARTGVATALFCQERGAQVTATDTLANADLTGAAAKLSSAGIALELGGHRRESFLNADLIVPSPGVPYDQADLVEARKQGVAVWSEIELAWRFLRGRLVAITGSNGKTTTTALTGHILKSAGLAVLVGGNIGTPLISLVAESQEGSIAVAEVSSFQLEGIVAWRPDISVYLNLTPDHIDRHGSMEGYAAAKARIFENQKGEDAAVMNADDAASARYAPSRPRVYWFSRKKEVGRGAFVRGDDIIFCDGDAEARLASRSAISLRGEHNLENVLAAATAACLAGAAPGAIAEAVRTFPGVEHRLQFVAEIGGVQFYNDSKATNVDATEKALEAFPGNLLVILGGKDKGSDYRPLAPLLARRARRAFLIGAAAEKIAGQIRGALPLEMSGTLERAVQAAYEAAQAGDVVLLAPACASFDQFQNFEHRGRVFAELVRELAARVAVPKVRDTAGGRR
ncbi:MAG TPA: UDP-N-acetylmuramoyl-L-alanine--D-glutamate ligase [Candidatus Acidoferrales bacterium]|nr:UDP-N-acetylmuramoyl-L-alanine--D-glutamate ligase [Candidatus Acidoferrales bacterium]